MTKKTAKKATAKKASKKAAKKTAKKASKKSTKKRTSKKKVFAKAQADKRFRLLSGEELSHYIELADALATMEDHVLKHHVGRERHDFANWVREVFNDKELADAIEPLHTRQEIRLTIYRHLVKKHLH